jgi:hypothetical protein
MHPLVNNIKDLKDVELENQISDLTKKYFMTRNPGVQAQISIMLDTYKEELSNRRTDAWNKAMENRDKSLDKLINPN